jgi:hypothetical protein
LVRFIVRESGNIFAAHSEGSFERNALSSTKEIISKQTKCDDDAHQTASQNVTHMMTGYTGARGNGIFDDLRFSSEIVHLGLPLAIYDALISTLTEQVDSEIVPSAVNLFKRKPAGQSFLAAANSPREGGCIP